MNTYKEYYQENVVPALMERFSFKSNMQALV
jgi:ribosomal protein L5